MSPDRLQRATSSSRYLEIAALDEHWREAGESAGAQFSEAGRSVQGRPIPRLDFGAERGPVVLLTSLVHGLELVGGLALLEVVRRLGDAKQPLAREILSRAHFVVLPVVNPDAVAANVSRLTAGRSAFRRCNANGVDLNRNFPPQVGRKLFSSPLSGSALPWSPYYAGPTPLSEPETRALSRVAHETRPALSLTFHSFGNLLLYPWAYQALPSSRALEYETLGRAFRNGQSGSPYVMRQSHQFYPVIGDMDDWLEAEFGTLAMTIEVGHLDLPLSRWRQWHNPFSWMNPVDARAAIDRVVPGVASLLACALGLIKPQSDTQAPSSNERLRVDFAAK